MLGEAFPPVALCYNRALRRASNRLLRLYDEALAPCGIKAFGYAVMAHLDRESSATLGDLADTFFIDRAVLRYKLGPLEEAGLIALEINENDRRARRLVLTDAGRLKVVQASRIWTRTQARIEEAIGTDEAETLRRTADFVASSAFLNRFLAA